MRIGLLGFGVVGRGVYDLTKDRSDMQVRKVLCLEDICLPDAESVKDIAAIVNDDTIDTVVEAMGGLHPAYEFVRAALENGKHEIDGKDCFVNIMDTKGKTKEEAVMETHVNMLDIQIPLNTDEIYGYTPTADLPQAVSGKLYDRNLYEEICGPVPATAVTGLKEKKL